MSNLIDLRNILQGQVLLPGDDGFDAARQPWNLTVDQQVAAVAEAADAADVAALVRYAHTAGLAVSAQPRGHGASTATAGTLLLRTGRLDELKVDPAARTARVGAGVSWGRLQAEAGAHGLTGLPGSSPVVSVTGYTLGGGVGWFARRHGLAADGVRAFEVVGADGEQARVTADSDPDLFWALRGGGGDFALVTALELDLHPAPELYGGRVVWPAERAPQVLEVFRRIAADAPDELTVWLNLLQIPGVPPMVTLDATYLGSAATGQDLLSPLEAAGTPGSDSRGVLPVADLGTITADPTDPVPGLSRTELLTGLDDTVAEALLAEPIAPLLSVQLRHLGGALARQSDSAYGPVAEPYSLTMVGLGLPDTAAAVRAKQQALPQALAPYLGGRKPLTLLGPGETAADAFTPGALARLQELKRHRDPQGVLRSNVPVLRGSTE